MTWGTAAAVAGSILLLAVLWWAIPSGTQEVLLRPKPTRRLARWVRSLLVRFALAVVAWPHLLDVFLRTKRAPTATRSKAEVWRDGNTVLWRYDSKERRHPEPVLLVHSLVTKPTILDLTPRRSLVGALLAQGFDVYLLDWGEVTWRQAHRGMVAYVEVLREAEAVALEASEAERVHVVGYCLGATLVLLRLLLDNPRPVASFAAIAPPVDLSVPGGFRSLLGNKRLRPVLALDGGSCVPAALIRESFHFLRPMAVRTQWRRLRQRVSWEEATYHAAMARWTWEHRRLPGALFFDLVDLYRDNSLLGALDRLDVPVFMALAQRDHIVPWASSAALARVPGVELESLVFPGGHVSMLVGAGRAQLWPGLAGWLASRQPELSPVPAGAVAGRPSAAAGSRPLPPAR